jgi:NAD(P)-dependent dehydrogenase (short-subunit alcohol dehydrogenase family)
MTRVVDEFGRLDSCFANAGMTGEPIAFVDATLADFRAVTTVNLDGVFLTLREAARHMIALGNGGSLVATSSMGTRFGAPRMQAYGASKAAVTAMVNGIAVELAPYGIRANTVLPGWAQTPMTDTIFGTPQIAGGLLRRIPAKRWGQPQDFSAIAVYLASSASVYHTADSILIDGGYSAF